MPTPDELKILAYLAIGLFVLFIFLCGQLILRRRNEQKIQAEQTPYTEQGLTQYDDFAPGEAVYLAWSEAGDFPRWHSKMQDDVRKNMPVLARALDRMVETNS